MGTVHRLPIAVPDRPRTRGDCLPGGMNAERPCPYVACRHHLLLDVRRTGRLQFTHDPDEIQKMPETCSLDVAERGGVQLREVGRLLNVVRERARQLEVSGAQKLRGPMINWFGHEPSMEAVDPHIYAAGDGGGESPRLSCGLGSLGTHRRDGRPRGGPHRAQRGSRQRSQAARRGEGREDGDGGVTWARQRRR